MRITEKEKLNELLGKRSFWSPNAAPGTKSYLYGLEGFEEVKAATESNIGNPMNIFPRPEGIELTILHRFKTYYAAVPYSILKSVSLETPDDIVVNKEKSVIGRAVLGGILLGPVGAIIGSMSGLKDENKAVKQDSLLTFVVEENAEIHHIVASVAPGIQFKALKNWLQKNLKAYYVVSRPAKR